MLNNVLALEFLLYLSYIIKIEMLNNVLALEFFYKRNLL